jgi:hypothetical protein
VAGLNTAPKALSLCNDSPLSIFGSYVHCQDLMHLTFSRTAVQKEKPSVPDPQCPTEEDPRDQQDGDGKKAD